MMYNILAVFIGGGLGSALRFSVGELMLKTLNWNFPAATFSVNIAGSFILGFLFALFIKNPEVNPSVKFALTAGFCGGFTTFSAFSLEVFEMIKTAQYTQAIAYILLSVIICVAAVSTGAYFAKFV